MKRYLIKFVLVAAVAALSWLQATKAQAQYVWDDPKQFEIPKHIRDFEEWMNSRLKPLEDYVSKSASGYYNLTRKNRRIPKIKECNPQGRLVMAFRGGRLIDLRGQFNGQPLSQGFVNNLSLGLEGSTWEFYEDGTFLQVSCQHQEFNLVPIKGRYSRDGNRIRFAATLQNGPGVTGNYSGEIVIAADGSATVTMQESGMNVGSVPQRFGGYSWNNQYTISYQLQLQPERGQGRAAAAQQDAAPKYTRPARPVAARLVGGWGTVSVENDVKVYRLLRFDLDGRCRFVVVKGDKTVIDENFNYRYENGTLTIVNQAGASAQYRIVDHQADIFTLEGPSGPPTPYIRLQ